MTDKKSVTDEELSVIDRLAQLGLTETDSKIYLHLLERGTAFGGSKIANRLALRRQYVHNSLQKLLKLDLIEAVPSGVRLTYKALPPQYLTNLAKKQVENAEKAVRELNLISSVGAEQDFEIYRGTQSILTFEEELVHNLKENDIQYIIGGGAQTFVNFYGDRYEEFSRVARSHGLRTKYIASKEDMKVFGRITGVFDDLFEFRVLDTLPASIVQTVVRFNTVTFYTFANPPLVYIVKSKAVFDDYKKFFDMLWNMAEPGSTKYA